MVVCATAVLARIHTLQGDFQMSHPALVAYATPDGTTKVVNRRFRWIPDHILRAIESIEGDHFNNIVEDVSERGIYLREFNPQTSPRTVGSRRAVIEEFGECEILIRSGYGRSSRSRSHSRSKERRNTQRIIY